MTDRQKVMEEFIKQKDFTDEKIKNGIEENRKGYAWLTVYDADGKPVPGAKITVTQKSHEFKFGANLFMLDELETAEKNAAYKKRFADLFNMATLPFYWDATEPQKGHTRYAKDSEKFYRRPAIDLCMEFCEENGIEPREHGLAYDHFYPDWLANASIPEIKAAYEKRCKEIADRYKDRIPTIEVTNEMHWPQGKTAIYSEPDFIEWSFKTAEKYFPANKLVINEWTGCPWGEQGMTTDSYYAYTEANLLKGARIDAIGMQYHMFYKAEDEYEQTRTFYNPRELYKRMDLYSGLGKPIQVTEVTIPAYSGNSEDEELQAEIVKTLYSIWFSHKNIEQIIYWNLVDGYAFNAEPGDMTAGENYFYGGLLRFDMSPKPAYYAIKNLIEKEWHTDAVTNTDAVGNAHFKGFYGTYSAEIEINGKVINKEFTLSAKSDNNISIKL